MLSILANHISNPIKPDKKEFDLSYLFKNIPEYKNPDETKNFDSKTPKVQGINIDPKERFYSFVARKTIKLFKQKGIKHLYYLDKQFIDQKKYRGELKFTNKIVENTNVEIDSEYMKSYFEYIFDESRTTFAPSRIGTSKFDYDEKIIMRSYAKHLNLDILDFIGPSIIPIVLDNGRSSSVAINPDAIFVKDGRIVGIVEHKTRSGKTGSIDSTHSYQLMLYCLYLRLLGINLEFAECTLYKANINKFFVKRYNNKQIIEETDKIANTIISILK